MNKEDFVTYEQALALKKLGFREKCLHHYDENKSFVDNDIYLSIVPEESVYTNDLYTSNNYGKSYIDAPTLAQAQKWLIDIKNKYVSPVFLLLHYWNCNIYDMIEAEPVFCSDISYSSYTEALSASITECLKLLQEK